MKAPEGKINTALSSKFEIRITKKAAGRKIALHLIDAGAAFSFEFRWCNADPGIGSDA
jgi:hypothetical protein